MEAIRGWFFGLSANYGVNPIVFGAIYVGAIPFFMISVAWLVRNARRKRPIALPLLSASMFFVSAYVYLIAVGRHVPAWVYLFLAAVVALGIVSTARRVSRKIAGEGEPELDVAVIGGGAAGLTAAGIAASFGAKTLLVERAKLGGDCTWSGCVPSKTLIKAAKVAHERRHASRYGLGDEDLRIDSTKLMEHVRTVRQGVYEHADAPPLFEAMGIDVRAGQARFVDSHTLVITTASGEEQRIRARYFVIATGSRPRIPEIPGIEGVPHLTSESVFELTEIPRRLLVVGGGPIGSELAQAFQRLGAEVTVVHHGEALLAKDDAELGRRLHQTMEGEGVRFFLGAEVKRLAREEGGVRVTVDAGGQEQTFVVDAVLLAAGRLPNLEGLDLEKAGVAFTATGITIDDRCRTRARHVFACGDVTGRYAFTHMAEHMAKVAATNVMLGLPSKIDTRHVPWCTFTDPELARVGASEAELEKAGVVFDVYRFPYDKIDRAITDGATNGLIKVFAKRATGKILGASILGERAGDLICELALAMRNGVTLRSIADTIHPYPTFGLGVRRAADQWYVRKRSKRVVAILRLLFGFRGPPREIDPEEIV